MTLAMHTEKAASDTVIDSLAAEDVLKDIKDRTGNWDKWSKQLGGRKKPLPIRKLLSANSLFWGLSTAEVIHCPMIARLVGLRKRTSKVEDGFDWSQAANDWVCESSENLERLHAIQAIGWGHALPLLTNRMSQSGWTNVLATLITYSRDVRPEWMSDAFVRFIVSCELPMTLAYALPELDLCFSQKGLARRAFGESLDTMLDGEGMPHARHLECIQLLLASCTRTIVLDNAVKKGRTDKAARLQYDWLSRQTLRWSRPNGTTIFTSAVDSPFFDELIRAAIRLKHDQSDAIAHRALRGKRKSLKHEDVPLCSEHSEWSELATLRTSWLSSSSRLSVSFSRNSLSVELGVGKQILMSGSCMPRIDIDDKQLEPTSDWEEVCWESDDDMDYVELECMLTGDWRIQRQFLLAKEDNFALIADAVLGPRRATIKCQHVLPLATGVAMEQADETNETVIMNSKRLGTIIPLSLPEWQVESRRDRLRTDPARLEIECRGRALYAPLFIDLDRARGGKALTWRRLTVAENLQSVPAESAVAYRLQIGKQQWVFYRSLDKPANRTILGLNLISEFLAARFNTNGEIETLIDIAG